MFFSPSVRKKELSLGNKIFYKCNHVEMTTVWIVWGLQPMTGIFYIKKQKGFWTRRHKEAMGRKPRDDEGSLE